MTTKYKVGDKVRLNAQSFDEGCTPSNYAEKLIMDGVLTVDEVVDVPINEDPDHQVLFFSETPKCCGCNAVDRA